MSTLPCMLVLLIQFAGMEGSAMLEDQFCTNLFLPSQLWSALWYTMVTTGVYHANCFVWSGIIAMGQRYSIVEQLQYMATLMGHGCMTVQFCEKCTYKWTGCNLAVMASCSAGVWKNWIFELWCCPSYGREVLRYFFHISSPTIYL